MKKIPPDVRERIDAELISLKVSGMSARDVQFWKGFAEFVIGKNPQEEEHIIETIRNARVNYLKNKHS